MSQRARSREREDLSSSTRHRGSRSARRSQQFIQSQRLNTHRVRVREAREHLGRASALEPEPALPKTHCLGCSVLVDVPYPITPLYPPGLTRCMYKFHIKGKGYIPWWDVKHTLPLHPPPKNVFFSLPPICVPAHSDSDTNTGTPTRKNCILSHSDTHKDPSHLPPISPTPPPHPTPTAHDAPSVPALNEAIYSFVQVRYKCIYTHTYTYIYI